MKIREIGLGFLFLFQSLPALMPGDLGGPVPPRERVQAIFAAADLNRSQILDFDELVAFQRRLVQTFQYLENETALAPVDFLLQGGGDCEDFAAFTVELLWFWGRQATIGVLRADGFQDGHCIALLKVTPPLAPATVTWPGLRDPSEIWMAIDYQAVGRIITPPGGESRAHWLKQVGKILRVIDADFRSPGNDDEEQDENDEDQDDDQDGEEEDGEGSISDWRLVERVSPRAIYGKIY